MKIIYLAIIICLNSYAFSNEKSSSYFYVDSDELIITENPLISEFNGNAYARDEINEFWGEKISISYDNNKKIKLIMIIGNIKIKRLNEEIIGDEAIYNLKLEKVRVMGNVSLIKNDNIINGDELIIDLINSTSIMNSNKLEQVSVKINK